MKFFSSGGANGTVDVSPALTGNFAGSMVVSSDQQVVAIGQVGNNPLAGLGVTGGTASAMYNGADATASDLTPAQQKEFVRLIQHEMGGAE